MAREFAKQLATPKPVPVKPPVSKNPSYDTNPRNISGKTHVMVDNFSPKTRGSPPTQLGGSQYGSVDLRSDFEMGVSFFRRICFPSQTDKDGCGSKPCTPGEHQNRWHMNVHAPQNGGIGYDPQPDV